MAPCLSKFPSVCLEAIFKHVPLVDLFYSVGMVCTTWYKSRRTELMRRKRLVLIRSCNYEQESLNNCYRVEECSYGTELIERVRRDDGSPWHTLETPQQFKFNYLPVPEGMQSVPFFSSLMNMPNITRLYLYLAYTILNLTQMTRLLDHLSEHLVDLKVYICFHFDHNNEDEDTATREHALDVTNVIGCLNRLRSLRHLYLNLTDLSSNLPLLSCLSHLTTFGISAIGFEMSMNGWIYASIRQYAQNVTSIQIDNQVDIREMPQFDAQLATKFNVMSVTHNTDDDENEEEIDDMQAMRLFCARFSALTILELDLSSPMSAQLPMTKLAQCLSSLTQLVHLNLELFTIPPVEAEQPEEGEAEDEEDGHEEQAQPQITQVPSVRLLTISFPIQSHRDSERLFIPEIFSNLQVLRLEHSFLECRDCEISRVYRFDLDRIAECVRLTRQPFRRCGHLHTVAFVDSGYDILINLDEL